MNCIRISQLSISMLDHDRITYWDTLLHVDNIFCVALYQWFFIVKPACVADTSLAEEENPLQEEKIIADDKWLCSLTTFLTDP